jgi:2-oxoisovalerate dehydrogenase E1 component beta subunit
VPAGWEAPIGVAELARRGDDLTIITYGLHRHLALQAAEMLQGEASVEVLDLRTLNPLDRESIVDSAVRCGRVLVVHEDNRSFGVGAEVTAVVAERCFYQLDAPVRRLAMPDVPAMPFATSLEAALTIGVDEILAAARALLQV